MATRSFVGNSRSSLEMGVSDVHAHTQTMRTILAVPSAVRYWKTMMLSQIDTLKTPIGTPTAPL
jgi:hypothetical protein